MRRWLRWGIAASFLLLLVVAGGFGWLRQSLPTTDGRLEIAGLRGRVDVLRDSHGVPHIFADVDHDAYFALGFVHAQDRLWQMEAIRRAGAGRLSEIIGPSMLARDRLVRTLGLYRRATEDFAILSPPVQHALKAYAEGVNAFLQTRRGPLPLEFQLLGFEPEPWTPADSLVWSKLMALQLSGNFREEILNARMSKQLSREQIQDLYPDYPAFGHVSIQSALPMLESLRAALPPPAPDRASNEWVVAGQLSATGKPILVNDPHLQLESPSLWYLVHIETPDLQIRGASVPGLPLLVLGQNADIAWGFTSTGSDVQDLFVELVDAANPTHYLAPDGPVPFELREEVIKVKDGAPVTLTVRETRHGPVVSDLGGNLASATAGEVVALAFTALQPGDTTAEAFYLMNRARGWIDFRDALRRYVAPQMNIAYADREGNIGMIAPGRIPVRREGNGLTPVPGDSGVYDWIGVVPFEALPQVLNPAAGRLVNANNRVIGEEYPYLLTHRWDDPYRAQRAQDLVDASLPYSVEAAERHLADIWSPETQELLPHLLATRPASEPAQKALTILADWDGHMRRDGAAPLIYSHWLRRLHGAMYKDELGELWRDYFGPNPAVLESMLARQQVWCDHVGTPDRAETCSDVLTATLDATVADLASRHGSEPSDWRWGREHRAPLPHAVFSRVPVLRSLFDIGIETDGGHFTLNRGATSFRNDETPFAHVHGSGYRAIYDFADPSNSRFVIAGGQSGNPLSPHYGDLVPLWRDGGHIRIPLTRPQIATSPHDILVLEPK